MSARDSRDAGSTTLTTVMLTPVFLVIAFAAFQAALWTHARTEARAVARDAAGLVARSGDDRVAVARSAEAALRDTSGVEDPDVSITVDADLVTVRVTGTAGGIFIGTSTPIDVTEALPVERFRG